MKAGALGLGLAALLAMVPGVGYCQDSPASQQPPQAQHETLIIAAHEWPPFLFAGEDGTPEGIVTELMGLCLPATGYTAELKLYPISRMFAYLEEGRIDINIMSHSEQRDRFARFGSERLFVSSYRPFVLADRDIRITSLRDFDALRLGHMAGLRCSPEFWDYVEARVEAGTAVTTPTQESLVRMLLADRIDVFVIPRECLAWWAGNLGVTDRIKEIDYDIATREYFVTVSRKSARIRDQVAFLAALDSCIRDSKADGRYDSILRRYGIERYGIE